MSDTAFVTTYEKADAGTRIGAVLLDSLPMFLLVPLNFIPVIGQLIFGVGGVAYWLFRDTFAQGRSFGKKFLNLDIVMQDGSAPTQNALIMRNVTFASPYLLSAIPFLGWVLGPPISIIVAIAELVLGLTGEGYRVGDRIASTRVIKAIRSNQ